MAGRLRSVSGQATVEWVGLVAVVALGLAALAAAAAVALAGAELASAIASRMLCAVGLEGTCSPPEESKLVSAYGEELAALVAEHAPTLIYEEGMEALPIDYRSCREDPCSMGAPGGEVVASETGEPVTLFTHAVDCRDGAPPGAEYDCSGDRAGNLYLQFWAYYPGSSTKVWGDRGSHPDDWESFQTRIVGDRVDSRASSHNGYNHRSGARNWLSDTGVASKSGWGESEDRYYISGGSHAGHAVEPPSSPHRWTPGEHVRLVPLEPIAARDPRTGFAVTPPWDKHVWSDPEYEGTD